MNDPQNLVENNARREKAHRRTLTQILRHMRLNTRLILVMAAITLPIFTVVSAITGSNVQRTMEAQTTTQLAQNNHAVITSLRIWLNFNEQTIQYLSTSPQITSLVAPLQAPFMSSISDSYPQLYLIHTMDMQGTDIARSDSADLTNYGDRAYFKAAAAGEEIAVESVIGRTTQRPAVIYAAPVRNFDGDIVQVVSFATEITDVSSGINVASLGETGFAFITDPKGYVIAHPDSDFTTELHDYSQYPPVKYMMEGNTGFYTFTDENGVEWHSYVDRLTTGHGVIVQQTTEELFSALTVARRANITGIVIGLVLTMAATWFFIRRTLQPIDTLTRAAEAMAAGYLNQRTNIRRGDELGTLATAFDSMAAQLRGVVGSLEGQVQERTRMLQITAEVSRNLSTILDPQQLTHEVVEQLKSAFGYYHAQIYLFDQAHQYLVLAGGTGEAGEIMLKRSHHLARGQGLVGRTAESKQAIVMRDVANAEGWLPNPLLPDTRAEIAVPILLGSDVVGVLDVQHNVKNGLSQQDADLLQAIANQVAIALQNAQAYSDAQKRAEREGLVSGISQQIQRAGTVDEVLQVALSGLNQALKSDSAGVELRSPAARKNGNS